MVERNYRPDDSIVDGKVSFNPRQKEKWGKVYGIVGHHSAVHICKWTKDSLTKGGGCYKNKFYGIDTHKCAEMSPATAWCQEACVFCWRPMEWYSRTEMEENEVDDPEYIIEETVRQRKKLLSGFGGNERVPKQLFKNVYESFPSHWAISLSGEPTIYPKIGEMIRILKKKPGVKSVFLVSNGQTPEIFLRMKEEGGLPTQLYISVDACNKEMFDRINRSVHKDGWERLLTTLHKVLPTLPTRRVIRYTLIRGLNDSDKDLRAFAEIYDRSKADFIEIKSYMFLGQSRQRLVIDNMADHDYIREYSKKILEFLPNYKWEDEEEASRIVLLKRKDSPFENRIKSPEPLESLRKGAAIPKEWSA